jgi:hypothetical protein
MLAIIKYLILKYFIFYIPSFTRGFKVDTNKLWVREIRKLTENGHQTSILTTDYQTDLTRIGARMFARCS